MKYVDEARQLIFKVNNASSLPSLAVKRKHVESPLKEKTAKLASACQLMTDSEYCDGGKKRKKKISTNWFVVNSFCATGLGGGIDPSCSPGGSGGGGGGTGKHNVQLPQRKKSLTIDQADSALKQMGYKRDKPSHEGNQLSYEVTDPKGNKKRMSVKEIRDLVYDAAANKPKSKRQRQKELLKEIEGELSKPRAGFYQKNAWQPVSTL